MLMGLGLTGRVRGRLAFLVAVAIGGVQFFVPGAALAQSFPGWANSHYMSPVTSSYMWDRGCDVGHGLYQGSGVTNLAVVLDFGYPAVSGSTYGAGLWSGGGSTFESTTWIADKVEQFGLGFYACSSTVPLLTIIAGVNSASSVVGSAHGTAWGSMVQTINTWKSTSPHNIASQVMAMGGIDVESGFAATPSMDRAWVNAFSAATSYYTYDFGDAAGCPTNASYTSYPGYTCNNGFTQDDYWYISWGAPNARPLPEIYNTTLVTLPNGMTSDHNAQQWEGIRRYGYYSKAANPIIPSGSTTQYTACGQPGHSCSGTNNTQSAGWTHLYNSLGAYTPTWSSLPWSTDFMWGW
jgi:hypothetical protein